MLLDTVQHLTDTGRIVHFLRGSLVRSTATVLLPLAAFTLTTLLPARAEPPKPEKFDDTGFVTIFDGKTLNGWKISAKTGHSGKSKNKSGGKWVVEDGAIVGSQDEPGNGGIIITEKEYGDFEVALEMRNDDGPDSGLFLRSTDTGKCYQAMIDYHKGGNLMGIYGEGLGGKPHVRNFDFTKDVTEIKVPSTQPDGGFKCPIAAADWPNFWKPGEWNELRARIEGNPPKLTTWIKGVKFMEYQDTEKRLGDKGGIALQVHGGGDYTKQFVRYRNIRVKELGKK
ncbi:MAG: DUF1080 domain-containing protein [Planctomycetes bacterium]|nr:DUF1080 domain-containing protein [Planctomycetota bacterium]